MATGKKLKIAIGSIMHESNSFNGEETTLADFRIREAGDVPLALAEWSNSNSEVAGFIEECGRREIEMVPTLYASATPKGPVAAEAFEDLTARLVQGMLNAGDVDGILLALHGAMYTEKFPQADEEILRRLRAAVGREMPLVLTQDFHANVSPELVEMADAVIVYQQNPHVDTKQRGVRAASILARMLGGEIRPRQALVKPAVLWNIIHQHTSSEPLRPITQASIDLEQRPGILAASVACGYQYNDVPWIGPSVIVVTDDDQELAQREAERLADSMWQERERTQLNLPGPAEAVAWAMKSEKFPVALFDVGDNVGGGASADETALLAELLRQGATGWVVVLSDPDAVVAAEATGIGGQFSRPVGGHSASSVTEPVLIQGAVRSLHLGAFVEPAVRHGGHRHWDMGHCAVIEQQGSTLDDLNLVLLTSRPTSPFSLHQLISCGINPSLQKILTVKGTVAPRASYEPIAAHIQLVDTPGATAVNPQRFSFHRARPGIWGLNA